MNYLHLMRNRIELDLKPRNIFLLFLLNIYQDLSPENI